MYLHLLGWHPLATNLILAIILLGMAVACFFYKQKLFVEYEYQFTNGEIDIEKIIEMKKRSKVVTFNIKEVGLLAPEGSDAVKDYSNKPKCYSKVLSYYCKGKSICCNGYRGKQ